VLRVSLPARIGPDVGDVGWLSLQENPAGQSLAQADSFWRIIDKSK
jgi:hypothetical protein